MWQLLVKYEPNTGKQESVKKNNTTPEYTKENQSWAKREGRGNSCLVFNILLLYSIL